jgi:hypothetical protein
MISLVNVIFTAVIGNKRSESHFIDLEGICILLELLEICPIVLKRIILSTLCDLLSNKKSLSYFIEWHSTKTG